MIRTICFTVVSGLVVSAGLLGCATAGQDDDKVETTTKADAKDAEAPAEAPVVQAPAEQPPNADAGPITVTGVLTYTELPATKSVEAYLGNESTLVDAAGTQHNLKSSDTVSYDELVGRSGQTVEVTCVPFPERQPPSDVSAPSGGPGQGSMPYPAGCTVTTLAAP